MGKAIATIGVWGGIVTICYLTPYASVLAILGGTFATMAMWND